MERADPSVRSRPLSASAISRAGESRVAPSVPAGARTAIALALGFVNHALFAAAIAVMVPALYGGLRIGAGPWRGGTAWAADAFLIAQFPLVHSILLSGPGRRFLSRLAPHGLGRDLAPTSFTLIASAQVLATFALWSPSGIVLHEATGGALWLWRALFAASWALLARALYDAGPSIQTGSIGWLSVLRGRSPDFGAFPTRGLFRRCRQPVYLAFACTLWTGPVHTLDGLVLALCWSTYCVAAPLHKELRYLALYGESFARYRSEVPYILPRILP